MKTVAAFVLIAGACIPTALAQSTIVGYAFSMDTADPVPDAQVILKNRYGIDIPGWEPVLTREDGYFEIHDVEPGEYVMNALGTFEDLTGEAFGVRLVSRKFAVEKDTVRIHFGFSVAEMKMRQELSSHAARARASDPDAGMVYHPPDWMIPRLTMIRSRIQIDHDNRCLVSSYAEKPVVL